MTRAKDISKIITDADFSGTLDVTGLATVGQLTAVSASAPVTINRTGSGNANIYLQNDGSAGGLIGTDGSGDTIFFNNSGVEKVRIDSSGNVGIGTSSPNYQLHATSTFAVGASGFNQQLSFTNDTIQSLVLGSGYTTLKLNPLGGNVGIGTTYAVGRLNVLAASNSEGVNVLGRSSDNRSRIQLKSNDGSTLYSQWDYSGTTVDFKVVSNIPLTFYTNSTERMRIDSSGNVGIGISSPTAKVDLVDDGVQLRLANSTTGTLTSDGSRIQLSGNDLLLINRESANIQLYTADTERMRIDASGNLGLNTGSSTGRATGKGMEILNVGTDTSATLRLTGENGSSDETFSEITHVGESRLLNFKHYGAIRMQIDANGGVLVDGGSVGTVSDSRVKKDVEDLSDGLSIVKQLRPVKFKYKGNTEYYNGDDKTYHGFIADEVKAIAPQYITEITNKIYDDEFDGSNIVDFDEELKDKKFTSVDDFKTMSQTDLIPMLVKAIQELEARITTLEGA